MYKLKPLTWTYRKHRQNGELVAEAQAVNHFYTIYTGANTYVAWHNQVNNTHGTREGFTTAKEAKEWVEGTHYPEQVTQWLEVVE